MTKFTEDILKNYDPVLGLGKDLQTLQDEKAALAVEIESAMKRKKNAEDITQAKKRQIEAYEALIEKGFDDESLLDWSDAISKAGLDKTIVTSELRKYASLRRLKEQLKLEVEDLRGQTRKLASEVESLMANKVKLIASIEIVTKEGTDALQAHLQRAEGSVSRIEKDALKNLTTAAEETKGHMADLEGSVRKTVATVNAEIDKMVERVEGLTKKAIQTGGEIEKLEALNPVLVFVNSGRGNKSDVLPFSHRYSLTLAEWAKTNQLTTIHGQASKLAEVIQSAIGGP